MEKMSREYANDVRPFLKDFRSFFPSQMTSLPSLPRRQCPKSPPAEPLLIFWILPERHDRSRIHLGDERLLTPGHSSQPFTLTIIDGTIR